MTTHDPLQAAIELREQLASEKRRLVFFFGAGTSIAVGLPGIDQLTEEIEGNLQPKEKAQYIRLKKDLPQGANVENMLDRIRAIRELIGKCNDKEYDGLKGEDAKDLDNAICKAISDIVRKEPPKGLQLHKIFAQWLRMLHSDRDLPVEIFTTNYDLLFERAMEEASVPFFDGFVGSVAPFFVPESVEAEEGRIIGQAYPPKTWTRLWKIHGSVNWHYRTYREDKTQRITRLSEIDAKTGEELVIFPSREKYEQSRKLPFLTFQDRLRKILTKGECLVVIVGYSISDQHLNQIIFQGLQSNPHLAVTTLFYGEKNRESQGTQLTVPEWLIQQGKENRNFTIYGPDIACIGGIPASWGKPSRNKKESENWPFWDETNKKWTLGDFEAFSSFLEIFIGIKKPSATTEPIAQNVES